MGLILPGTADAARIEAVLANWRQGDFTLTPVSFHTLHHPNESAVEGWEPDASEEGSGEPSLGIALRDGAVLVSQTCDVVRGVGIRNRNFVQVCALMRVASETMVEVKRGKSPQFAYLPGVEEHGMVVDLNVVAIVEKPLLASWNREPGCRTDKEVTAFAAALSRHKKRFAFPDDFSDHTVRPLQERAAKRTSSQARLDSKDPAERLAALEAVAFNALLEIRAKAEPDWDNPSKVTLKLLLKDEESGLTTTQWEELRSRWEGLLKPHGKILSAVVEGPIAQDEMSVQEYLRSQRLDLDYLSS